MGTKTTQVHPPFLPSFLTSFLCLQIKPEIPIKMKKKKELPLIEYFVCVL